MPAGEICVSVRRPRIPLPSQPGCFSPAARCTCTFCPVPAPKTPSLLFILQKGLHKNVSWEQQDLCLCWCGKDFVAIISQV